MLKKVVGGTLLVGLVGILVFGAINRTQDRTDKVGEGQGQGYGKGRSVEELNAGVGNGRGAQAYSQVGGNGRGGGGFGQSERQYPNDEAVPNNWLTVEGSVVQVPGAGVELVIETSEGEQLEIGTGPMDWAAQGFTLQLGEPVQVQGYWEAGEFKAAQVTRLETGQTIALRDEYGRPEWAGQGGSTQQTERGGTGEAQVEQWVRLQGRVVAVDTTALVLTSDAGEQIEVTGRPWQFAQELGFQTQVGDELTLTGFFKGDEFEVGLLNTVNGQTAILRDENGRPMWTGRGQRGG